MWGTFPELCQQAALPAFEWGFTAHIFIIAQELQLITEISLLLHYYLKAAPWANLQTKAGTSPVLWVPAAPRGPKLVLPRFLQNPMPWLLSLLYLFAPQLPLFQHTSPVLKLVSNKYQQSGARGGVAVGD